MPRLFVAIDPGPTATAALAALQQGLAGANWTPPEQFHLTLFFIGEVDRETGERARAILREARAEPFDLELQGLGCFPPRRAPRVLWAGTAASPPLLSLQGRIERLLRRCGLAPERRRFSPHITLARFRAAPSRGLGDYLRARSLFRTGPWRVDAFYLYSSILDQAGALHRREECYPLASDGG